MAIVKDPKQSRVGDGAKEIAFKDDADDNRRAKGVVVIDAAGLQTGISTNPMAVDIVDSTGLADTPEFFEDTSFVTGDSPVTLDLNAALGRNATKVLIINDGAGNFTYQLSTDGAAFGDAITLKKDEWKEYSNISVDSVKITWVSDSAYRVEAI